MLGNLLTGNRRLTLKAGTLTLNGNANAVPMSLFATAQGAYLFLQLELAAKPETIGWFATDKLRKSRKVTVENTRIGGPKMTLVVDELAYESVLVWLDSLEEHGLQPAGPTKPGDLTRVEMDPRVRSVHTELDGFCDGDGRGPPRKAYWVYLMRGYYNTFLETTAIHECTLKEVVRQLTQTVVHIPDEEWSDRFGP